MTSPASPPIDAALARRLVAAQFPQWAELPIRPLPGGWDNRSFRLGEALLLRLPSAGRYAAQVEKEQMWLPRLAPQLPLEVPTPVAAGRPGEGYPHPWSVLRWIDGETPDVAAADLARLARDLGGFLVALRAADARDGPPAGAHSFHRGGSLSVYDAETRAAAAALSGRIDATAALTIWEQALAAAWRGPPVWIHGDVAPGNLLVRDGRLCAVIDFGCAAVGDPACDLAIAWTTFGGESRAVFQDAVGLDDATWARARGWALWKALIVLARTPGANPAARTAAVNVVRALLDPGFIAQT